jgi:DNA topoisomerase I
MRRGESFAYRTAAGRALRDAATLARIRKIVIPPAWQDVWICADARGHIQATGRDARARKQYRYHADWQAQRGQTKFEHLLAFCGALPRIRARVQAALADGQAQPTRERVLATLVRLLDTTWLRVGNAEYARDNASFGLSTLRNRHAGVRGATVTLAFKGKSGVRHEARIEDRRVARVVRRCRELPGQALFQYVDDEGETRAVGSADINNWLADAAGTHVTAKDFRTWHGSVQALDLTLAACADGAAPSTPQQVLAQVARRLGNTPAVCRKAYIHPGVLALGEGLADEATRGMLRSQPWVTRPPARRGLGLHERRLLGLLMQARKRRKNV